MEIIVPHVNLNGNSKKDLLDQTLNCHKAMTDAIVVFTKNSDFGHGRNSTDSEHAQLLRVMNKDIAEKMLEITGIFQELYNKINEQ